MGCPTLSRELEMTFDYLARRLGMFVAVIFVATSLNYLVHQWGAGDHDVIVLARLWGQDIVLYYITHIYPYILALVLLFVFFGLFGHRPICCIMSSCSV